MIACIIIPPFCWYVFWILTFFFPSKIIKQDFSFHSILLGAVSLTAIVFVAKVYLTDSNVSIWERVNALDLNPGCTLESLGVVKKKYRCLGPTCRHWWIGLKWRSGQRYIFWKHWVISHMESGLKTTALLLWAWSYWTFKWRNKTIDCFFSQLILVVSITVIYWALIMCQHYVKHFPFTTLYR